MRISPKKQIESWFWWQSHIKGLSGNGQVTSKELSYLETLFQKRDIIGYEEDRIRPDEMGKLDVFQDLECCDELPHKTRLILAGLTEDELKILKTN